MERRHIMSINERKRIYLSSPTMHGEELRYVNEAFDTNWIAPLGPNVNEFENDLSGYISEGAENKVYCAALSSGTAAIHLALINENIGAGDIVFCSDLTFAATCNPINYQGARAVFIDSEEDTWNMSPIALKNAFEKYPEVKAVIVVNLYGVPAKLDEIGDICKEHNVPLIEDAAESLGALYKGKQTGTFGSQSAVSFNGNKIITSSGGGMLLSSDEEKIKRARFLSTQAREPARHYEHKETGYNYRMSNVIAGIGRGQLIHLNEHISLKKKIYYTYKEAFSDIEKIKMNPIPDDCRANYWLSCMMLKTDSRVRPVDIMTALEKENIEARPIWKPMHMQPVYSQNDFVSEADSSVSEKIFENGVCLPSDIKNTEEDMNRIIKIIRDMFNV